MPAADQARDEARDQARDEARDDRRVVIIALGVMVALVLFGVGFGSLFAATNCRQLRPIALEQPIAALAGDEARAQLADEGLATTALTAAEGLLGPLVSVVRLPLEVPLRIGPVEPLRAADGGVLVTGDGVVRVDVSGDVVAGATFRRPVTVVGDGSAVYALVVGNALTGQVDALRPLIPGTTAGPTAGSSAGMTADSADFAAGTCVDTSAVGSPLSFLHDAREGTMLGLRTDEDGSDAVLELRDPVRGRVWAPSVELPRAPAGLQGSRTSGAIGPDTVVMVRRLEAQGIAEGEATAAAVRALVRTDATLRWELSATSVRDALAGAVDASGTAGGLAEERTLRLEVAAVEADVALVTVQPDVVPDALLPRPTFGPLGVLAGPDPRTVTLVIALHDGAIVDVIIGPAPNGRDGAERDALLAELSAAGVDVTDVRSDERGTWLLVGRGLARFGG